MSGIRSTKHDWPTSPGQDCLLFFRTPLNSTDMDVLRNISENTVLEVETVVENGRTIVAAIHPQHGLAGVITSTQAATLLSCMALGHRYTATVTQIRPPACQVEIRPRQ